MEPRFDGKNALVTGAGKGIGRGIAIALARSGAVTHALSRTQADLDTLQEEVPGIITHQVDLTDWEKTRNTVRDIGHIDLLVNNAGIYLSNTFIDATQEDFDKTFNTNIKAAFNISQVIAKGMVERGGGTIVNVSSMSSVRATSPLSVYGMSKAALDMMTMNMAAELGPHNIRVNSVNPGFVLTDKAKDFMKGPEGRQSAEDSRLRTPIGRFCEIEEVVNLVLYLLSDKSSMVTGAKVPIEGGRILT